LDTYIWQQPDWPHFTCDLPSLLLDISKIAHSQGKVETPSDQLGFSDRKKFEAQILVDEIYHSHESNLRHYVSKLICCQAL
jgi:Fic family protein